MALELSWINSKLFQFILDLINQKRSEKIAPILNAHPHRKIASFTDDKDVVDESKLYIVKDGFENKTTGDLQLIHSCQTANGKMVNIIIECKESKGIASFFEKCQARILCQGVDEVYIGVNLEDTKTVVRFFFLFPSR